MDTTENLEKEHKFEEDDKKGKERLQEIVVDCEGKNLQICI